MKRKSQDEKRSRSQIAGQQTIETEYRKLTAPGII